MDDLLLLRLAGLAAIVGAAMYTLGDMLLLAVKAAPDRHPALEPHLKLLGGMERLAELDPRRIAPGGLIGVYGTPLVLLGWWHLARGLAPAGDAALVPVLLFAIGSVVGAFVHGWFMAIADDVRLLDVVSGAGADAVLEVVARHRRILAISYAPIVVAILVASVWTSLLIAQGKTAFPTWLAATNPITLLLAFLVVRRLLPAAIGDRFEGTGFSVAYLVFFALTTAALWDGIP